MHGVARFVAAHLAGWLQAAAERGSLGAAEDAAAHVAVELHARDAGRFALGHAGDRAGDRRGDAAGAATRATGRFQVGSRGFEEEDGGRHGTIVLAGGARRRGRLKSIFPNPPPCGVSTGYRRASQRGLPSRSGRDGSGHAQ
jgi:hypothetical protein